MASRDGDLEARIARQGRLTALVIAGTTVLWVLANWVGGAMGLPGNYAILFDLLALAGFGWAFINILDLWRKRRTLRK